MSKVVVAESKIIDVGKEFGARLANRDSSVGDGKCTAIQFRRKYLKDLDNQAAWKENWEPFITFDFSTVKKMSPGWANEAIGYFTQYASDEHVLSRIKFINLSPVMLSILKEEVHYCYKGELNV